jgi:NitT/TauT family transport system permease protein
MADAAGQATQTPPPGGEPDKRSAWQDPVRIAQLLFPLALLALWQVLAVVLGDFFVAPPLAALDALLGGVSAGWLGADAGVTLIALVYGYAFAVVFGVVIGFLLGLSHFAYAVFEPIVIALYALPKVALYPIFLFAFGLGIASQAWFAMFFGVFPIIIFTMSGTRNVSEVMFKVGRSLRLSRLQLFRTIVFPAILPSLVAGLRIGFGVTFLGVILSQMFAARSGLGYVLMQSVSLHDMPRIYGLVLLLTLFAFAINGAFLLWEHFLTRNRPSEKGAF